MTTTTKSHETRATGRTLCSALPSHRFQFIAETEEGRTHTLNYYSNSQNAKEEAISQAWQRLKAYRFNGSRFRSYKVVGEGVCEDILADAKHLQTLNALKKELLYKKPLSLSGFSFAVFSRYAVWGEEVWELAITCDTLAHNYIVADLGNSPEVDLLSVCGVEDSRLLLAEAEKATETDYLDFVNSL